MKLESTLEPIVFVVDDDAGAQRSLRYLIESDGLPVKCFSSAQEFLDAFDPDAPGCLVVDYRMPGMTGLDLHRQLRNQDATLPVIVITGHGDVATCARAFKAGVLDFLEKPVNDDRLLDRIRAALAADAATRAARRGHATLARLVATLTPREREVMDRLIAGKEMKEIAAEFATSFQTIAKHRAKVLEKLGVDNDVELARRMFEIFNKPFEAKCP